MNDSASVSMVREYYRLAKPGILYGNLLTTTAAFLFAFGWKFTPTNSTHVVLLYLATAIGISCVIGSSAVLNNYLDRDIDRKMERTKDRALVTGKISGKSALAFATVLGIIGFSVLILFVNLVTTCAAALGFISYVIVYGYAKRTTHWAAMIGTIPGAVPIVVGYTAVAGRFDIAALILFLVMAAWQIPHFYAIAMYRMQEYVAAGIPVFPAKKGFRTTKLHILFFIAAYLIAAIALWVYGYAGVTYLASVLVFGLLWLWKGIQGFTHRVDKKTGSAIPDEKWARGVFLFSLIVLMTFCVTISVAPLLP